MKKKLLIFVVTTFFIFGLVGCDFFGGGTTTQTPTTTTVETTQTVTTESALTIQLKYVYNLATTSGEFTGTYEEWLETVRGPEGLPGEDGRDIELRVASGIMQWRYVDESNWVDLYDLNNLRGTDGKEVDFRVTSGVLEWQFVGDTNWTVLLDFNQLLSNDVTVSNVTVNENDEIIITYTDGSTSSFGSLTNQLLVIFRGFNGFVIDIQRVNPGESAVEPTIEDIPGFSFIGWDKDFSNVQSDLTIVAEYELNTYSITFDENGGTDVQDIINVSHGTTVTLPEPTIENGNFIGWFYGNSVNDGQFTNSMPVTENITLYARYIFNIANTFTVTFYDILGNVLDVQQVLPGNDAVLPIAPAVVGYEFVGWEGNYLSVYQDSDVYPVYVLDGVNSYSITYVLDGGNNNDDNPFFYNEETTDISLLSPTKDGYLFEGWYLDQDFAGEIVNVISGSTFTGNITLYAKWSALTDTATITFITNSPNSLLPVVIAKGEEVGVLPMPSNPGYQFAGWFFDEDLTDPVYLDFVIDQDITVYAMWVEAQTEFLVYFNVNGGFELSPLIFSYGEYLGDLPIPFKDGYIFGGWYLDQLLVNEATPDYIVLSDITLYAKWLDPANSITISFVTNGGTDIPDLILGQPTEVWINEISIKDGYAFLGWYTDEDLTQGFFDGDYIDQDTTLFALWYQLNDTEHSIYYVLNGGNQNILNPEYYSESDLPAMLYNPGNNDTDAVFLGWFLTPDMTSEPINSIPEGSNTDITLFAGWDYGVEEFVTINFELNGANPLSPITIPSGQPLFLTEIPYRDGFVFTGWFFDELLSNPIPIDGVIYPEANITLYAGWILDVAGDYRVSYLVLSSSSEAGLLDILLDDEFVLQQFAGYGRQIIITNKRVLSWGINNWGQTGVDSNEPMIMNPVDISGYLNLADNESIYQIEIDTYHTLILTSNGRLFGMGSNQYGELAGLSNPSYYPQLLNGYYPLMENETVMDMATGFGSTIIATTYGRVFVSGINNSGMLGTGSYIDEYDPVEITNNIPLEGSEYVINIEAGQYHTLILTSSNRLLVVGGNDLGQLGNGLTAPTNEFIDMTYQLGLDSDEYIVYTYADAFSSGVLTTNNRLITWGASFLHSSGEIIPQLLPLDITSEFEIDENDFIIDYSIGIDFNTVLTSYGRIFTWGNNTFGQLGDGTLNANYSPTEIIIPLDMDIIYNIESGFSFTTAISGTGNLYVWGGNTFYQLGTQGTDNVLEPILLLSTNDPQIFIAAEYWLNEGDSITEFTPYKPGYVFDGWYLDAEMTIPFTLSTMPGYDLDLYGKFVEDSYMINYYLDGGTNSDLNPTSFNLNDEIIYLQTPTKTGYTFAGWYLESSFETQVNIVDPSISSDVNLYAKWISSQTNTYTITFNTNGGGVLDDAIFDFDEPAFLHHIPFKTGFDFIGWYKDIDLTIPFEEGIAYNEDMTLYAKYEEITAYNVIYNIIMPNTGGLNLLGEEEYFVDIENKTTTCAGFTNYGRVFVWGSNYYGAIPFEGETAGILTPLDITSYFNFSEGEVPIAIDISDHNGILATNYNRVFTWGDNSWGQLGLGFTNYTKYTPQDISNRFAFGVDEEIMIVESGTLNSYLLTTDGRLFGWGYAMYRTLGESYTSTQSSPVLLNSSYGIANDVMITDMAVSGNSVIFLDSTNKVYTVGNSKLGVNGISTSYPYDITNILPKEITDVVYDVAEEGGFFKVRTQYGLTITWGNYSGSEIGSLTAVNEHGHYIIEDLFNDYLQPGEVINETYGTFTIYAITSYGRVLALGDSTDGIFMIDTGYWSDVPIDITSHFEVYYAPINQIFMGHSDIIIGFADRNYIGYGLNNKGQVGNSVTAWSYIPSFSFQNPEFYPYFVESVTIGELVDLEYYIMTGYVFSGWYIDSAMTILYTQDIMPSNDLVLYGSFVVG
jgi:uncharacterized repeat protein (TIGR02543 family)